MKYLLDTNICIYLANERPPEPYTRFAALSPGDVGMSLITWFELAYGCRKSAHAGANLRKLNALKALIPVLPLDEQVALVYADLRIFLDKRGTPVGAFDLLIAAHAIALQLILVTNNEREFRRIPNLRVENWVK